MMPLPGGAFLERLVAVVDDEAAELDAPCTRCGCCRRWLGALQLLASHIIRHRRGELRSRPCNDECLVCSNVAWQGEYHRPEGDGARLAATQATPCGRCGCCRLWSPRMGQLRDHIAAHVAGELRLAPCDPHCLLCAELPDLAR